MKVLGRNSRFTACDPVMWVLEVPLFIASHKMRPRKSERGRNSNVESQNSNAREVVMLRSWPERAKSEIRRQCPTHLLKQSSSHHNRDDRLCSGVGGFRAALFGGCYPAGDPVDVLMRAELGPMPGDEAMTARSPKEAGMCMRWPQLPRRNAAPEPFAVSHSTALKHV